ncbi:MAG: hypothetical protein ACNA8W_06410, partial [Bradymonadaceae bacterium]
MIEDEQLIPQVLAAGLLDQDGLQKGLQFAKEGQSSLYYALIVHQLANEHDVVRVASEMLNVPSVSLRERDLDRAIAEMIPASLALRNRTLPLKMLEDGGKKVLLLAMADPIDVLAMDEIASHTGVNIRPVLVGPVDLDEALERLYKSPGEAVSSVNDIFAELEEISGGDIAIDNGPASELNNDSWAALFDDKAPKDDFALGGEESAVISQDMRDRPPTDVFEAVSRDSLDLDEGLDEALADLDGNLNEKQASGGVGMNLDDWDLDEAFKDDDQAAADEEKLADESSEVTQLGPL